MWAAIGLTSLLVFFIALVGGVIFAFKRNPIWKKWLVGAGAAFVLLITAATTDSTPNTNKQPTSSSPNKEIQSSTTSTPIDQPDEASENNEDLDNMEEQAAQTITSSPSTQSPAASETVTSVPPPQVQKQEETVYVTKTGEKYHRAGCRSLARSQIPISLSEAKSSYAPCSVCNPPI